MQRFFNYIASRRFAIYLLFITTALILFSNLLPNLPYLSDEELKALQVKRIGQAHDTGSDVLVTACPKCQIHLRCAMEDPFQGEELKMEMMDTF